MIIARIYGRLGNQLFQYVAAKALAIKLKAHLYLDISTFNSCELENVFTLKVQYADKKTISKILGWQSPLIVRKLIKKFGLKAINTKNLVLEPNFLFWDGFEHLKDDIYLDGYWQSAKYFDKYKKEILKDLNFKGELGLSNQKILNKISTRNSVSLHVRRGDYLKQKHFSTHGVCSFDYYKKALKYIESTVENPFIVVFSDDMQFVKQNLIIPFDHMFSDSNRTSNNYKDMWLMSLCQHNIIANSTFSWWGAWLNKNKNKIVIAPKKWFACDKLQKYADSIYCDRWVKL